MVKWKKIYKFNLQGHLRYPLMPSNDVKVRGRHCPATSTATSIGLANRSRSLRWSTTSGRVWIFDVTKKKFQIQTSRKKNTRPMKKSIQTIQQQWFNTNGHERTSPTLKKSTIKCQRQPYPRTLSRQKVIQNHSQVALSCPQPFRLFLRPFQPQQQQQQRQQRQ